VGGRARGLRDGSLPSSPPLPSPVVSRSKAPVGGLGDEVPQKLKKNVKLAYNFCRFLYKILDLMNIRAGLGEYILQSHNTKFFEDSMGVEPPNRPSGYASEGRRKIWGPDRGPV